MSTRLRYTPRSFVIHPEKKTLIIAESDYGAIPAAEREDLADLMAVEGGALKGVEFDEERAAQEEQYGAPKVDMAPLPSASMHGGFRQSSHTRLMSILSLPSASPPSLCLVLCLFAVARVAPWPL